MRDVQDYIDRIIQEADLAPGDEERVRRELGDHLYDIVESTVATEELAMTIEREFGQAEDLGREIARAKGRFRTYLKKEARKFPIVVAVAVVLAIAIRLLWITPFQAVNDVLAPAVSKGDILLVNKLSADYRRDDIVVFREAGRAIVGIVKELRGDAIIINRKAEGDRRIPRNMMVGRVFDQWRRHTQGTLGKPWILVLEAILLVAGLGIWVYGKVKAQATTQRTGRIILWVWIVTGAIVLVLYFT